MRRFVPAVSFACALGCKPSAESSQPEAATPSSPATSAEASGLRFAWPEGASALVTERILKKGKRATTRYRIVTERRDGEILVYYRDFAFVELEGVDLSDPKAREALARLESQVAGAMPPYRIALDGTWRGCGDLDVLGQALEGVYPPDKLAMLRTLLANPKMREAVESQLENVWDAWAETWIGWELPPGTHNDGVFETNVDGRTVKVPFIAEHLGEEGGLVRLRVTTTFQGSFEDLVGDLLQAVIESLPPDKRKLDPEALAAHMRDLKMLTTSIQEATLDPKTLLPKRAMSRTDVVFSGGSKGDERRVEEHEWTFEWNGE
jgi:hypothetical protein